MKRFLFLILLLLTLVSVILVFIPAFLIRPFAAQSYTGLSLSYKLRGLNPGLTLALLVISLPVIALLWRKSPTRKSKIAVATAAALLLAAAIFSRQNHFEWMFHPAPPARFVEVAKASHLKDTDLILGIQVGKEFRAYPVRMMAYHHVLNDTVAGQSIVVTY